MCCLPTFCPTLSFLKNKISYPFQVCRNGSFHLKGNVYVHYRSLESAILAYQSINGRYFAGKQVHCFSGDVYHFLSLKNVINDFVQWTFLCNIGTSLSDLWQHTSYLRLHYLYLRGIMLETHIQVSVILAFVQDVLSEVSSFRSVAVFVNIYWLNIGLGVSQNRMSKDLCYFADVYFEA